MSPQGRSAEIVLITTIRTWLTALIALCRQLVFIWFLIVHLTLSCQMFYTIKHASGWTASKPSNFCLLKWNKKLFQNNIHFRCPNPIPVYIYLYCGERMEYIARRTHKISFCRDGTLDTWMPRFDQM